MLLLQISVQVLSLIWPLNYSLVVQFVEDSSEHFFLNFFSDFNSLSQVEQADVFRLAVLACLRRLQVTR